MACHMISMICNLYLCSIKQCFYTVPSFFLYLSLINIGTVKNRELNASQVDQLKCTRYFITDLLGSAAMLDANKRTHYIKMYK